MSCWCDGDNPACPVCHPNERHLLTDVEAVFVAAALHRITSTVADFGQITRHLRDCGASSFKIAAIARAVVALEDAHRALAPSSEVTT